MYIIHSAPPPGGNEIRLKCKYTYQVSCTQSRRLLCILKTTNPVQSSLYFLSCADNVAGPLCSGQIHVARGEKSKIDKCVSVKRTYSLMSFCVKRERAHRYINFPNPAYRRISRIFSLKYERYFICFFFFLLFHRTFAVTAVVRSVRSRAKQSESGYGQTFSKRIGRFKFYTSNRTSEQVKRITDDVIHLFS